MKLGNHFKVRSAYAYPVKKIVYFNIDIPNKL